MSTPPQPSAQPEYVTINGIRYKLIKCNRCTGSFDIYLINKEPDKNKSAIWETHNKDGALHQHDKKSSSGGGWVSRPPALKFSIRMSRTIGGSTIELQAEFLKTDSTFDKAYEEMKAKLDAWAKQS